MTLSVCEEGMNPRVSVCMGTYNGERWVVQQVLSILGQIDDNDELIVVDDCSQDATLAELQELQDSRVKIHVNAKNLGPNRNFEKALSLAKGEFIFLADQDDVWCPGRVDMMVSALRESGAKVVATNFALIGANGQALASTMNPLRQEDEDSHLRNILAIFAGTICYYGCAMALRREFLPFVVPFPEDVESHDLWIALAANVDRSIVHLEAQTLLRRIHGGNVSVVSRSFREKLRSRRVFTHHVVLSLIKRCKVYCMK